MHTNNEVNNDLIAVTSSESMISIHLLLVWSLLPVTAGTPFHRGIQKQLIIMFYDLKQLLGLCACRLGFHATLTSVSLSLTELQRHLPGHHPATLRCERSATTHWPENQTEQRGYRTGTQTLQMLQ